MVTKSKTAKAQEWWTNLQRQKSERFSFVGDTLFHLAQQLDAVTRVQFPSDTYARDPVRFFREILGIEPWHRQVEIIEAIRDYPRVAVKSGHKVSKSNTASGASLWYYCSFTDARVVMTSVTSRQVDQILWRELKMMRARGGRCLACKHAMLKLAEHKSMQEAERAYPRPCPHSAYIDGEMGEQARTGLKSADFREIVGFTAREAEAVAGISGKNLLYLPDEASGIPQPIFDAIEGNRAGGARLAMFSNPTRNEGEFYDAFNAKKHLYYCITVSSEETPNVVEGREVIPGLATRDWIEEKKSEWGEDSALYKVRVKGEFAELEEGKLFSIHAIDQAEQRWAETAEDGRLFIGVDPAGPTGSGDETVLVARRGYKMLKLRAFRGLSEEAHLVHLLAFINELKAPREVPVVVLDREGKIGSALYGYMQQFTEQNRTAFELVVVRASDRAFRQPQIYDRVRDELGSNLENWMREGGALLEDAKLAAELHSLEMRASHTGRLKLTPKEEIRKALGRSPDRYDALSLAVWEPVALGPAENAAPSEEADNLAPGSLDPYAGLDVWQSR